MTMGARFGLSFSATAYYDVLARLDIGPNAASIFDGRTAPWSERLAALHPNGDRSDHVQVLPLITPGIEELIAILRQAGDFEHELAAVVEATAPIAAAGWTELRPVYEQRLDEAVAAIAEPLAAARTALWTRAKKRPPPLLVLDARPLGRHARGASFEGRQIVAASFDQSDEDLFCRLLHEETHAVSDPAVFREHAGRTRSTNRGDDGYAVHRAVEAAALSLADDVVNEAVPELARHHHAWVQRARS